MLTRLRIQGFKNLLDVDVRFGPFTCIAGVNAVGKSNVFDAIRFLQLLSEYPIMEAAALLREARGRSPRPRSLLTSFEHFRADEMRFQADMVVEREVEDDFGVSARAAISSLRYTVAFRLAPDGQEQLQLVEESLVPVAIKEAPRTLAFPHEQSFRVSTVNGKRGVPFVSSRTLRKFRSRIASATHRVADYIEDFSPLRAAPAFAHFEHTTRAVLDRVAWGWSDRAGADPESR